MYGPFDERDPISTCRRMREHKPKETDQWRRHELVRLNSLPVSARIIVVRPGSPSPDSPTVLSRTGFNNEIDFTVSPFPFVCQSTLLRSRELDPAAHRALRLPANPISWSPRRLSRATEAKRASFKPYGKLRWIPCPLDKSSYRVALFRLIDRALSIAIVSLFDIFSQYSRRKRRYNLIKK